MEKKTKILMICLAFIAIVSLFFNILQFRFSGSMLKALNETPAPSATPSVTPTCSMDITQIPTAATATAVVTDKPTATVSSTPAPTAAGAEKLRYIMDEKGEHYVIYIVYNTNGQEDYAEYTFRYIVKNNGKTILDESDLFKISIHEENGIVAITTNKTYARFYDTEEDKLSDRFELGLSYNSYDDYLVRDKACLVAYEKDDKIIVRDIFNSNGLYKEIKPKEEKYSSCSINIVNENEVYFEYYSDRAQTKLVKELVNFNK